MLVFKIKSALLAVLFSISIVGCSSDTYTDAVTQQPDVEPAIKQYKYLALGDSYTIGESVCFACRFPNQLKHSLENSIPNSTIHVQFIAQTGMTTANLQSAINTVNPRTNNDLVTLLIGVNNQFQGLPFSNYILEFPQLLARAKVLAGGKKSNVIVVSIPDYYFTPIGQQTGSVNTSQEIDFYNNFAKNYCEEFGYTFINITDITRDGIINPTLVASDDLHLSELAYSKFVERILPIAIEKLTD